MAYCEKKFYGTVLVGERGQVVIPKEARKGLGIKAGDKLIVFGGKALVLVKADVMKKMAEKLLKSVEG